MNTPKPVRQSRLVLRLRQEPSISRKDVASGIIDKGATDKVDMLVNCHPEMMSEALRKKHVLPLEKGIIKIQQVFSQTKDAKQLQSEVDIFATRMNFVPRIISRSRAMSESFYCTQSEAKELAR